MSNKQVIKDLMKQGDYDDSFVTMIDVLMTRNHQQWSEIKEMPVPLVNKLMERADKEQKEINKSIKKKR